MTKSEIIAQAKMAEQILETSNMESDIYLEALCAAARLLEKVEVLPEGELPQENDLVISKTNTHFSTPFWVDSISESGYVKSYMGAICFNASASEFQIIQRAGKPVIIEKEGV